MRWQDVRGNYTKPENLHLTLAFIGEYTDPDTVLGALAAIPATPFAIALKGFGSFGNLFWAGIENCNELSAYVKHLRHSLAERGIPFDRKKFSPHITLVRQAVCGNELPRIHVSPAAMETRCISLMRSDRGKNGTIYTEVGGVDLSA